MYSWESYGVGKRHDCASIQSFNKYIGYLLCTRYQNTVEGKVVMVITSLVGKIDITQIIYK